MTITPGPARAIVVAAGWVTALRDGTHFGRTDADMAEALVTALAAAGLGLVEVK